MNLLIFDKYKLLFIDFVSIYSEGRRQKIWEWDTRLCGYILVIIHSYGPAFVFKFYLPKQRKVNQFHSTKDFLKSELFFMR